MSSYCIVNVAAVAIIGDNVCVCVDDNVGFIVPTI